MDIHHYFNIFFEGIKWYVKVDMPKKTSFPNFSWFVVWFDELCLIICILSLHRLQFSLLKRNIYVRQIMWGYIIKKVGEEIVKPLTNIFNLSLSTGVVPDKLKTAKVIPIYKKAYSAMFTNYRPVSLLSCFSQILERLVFDRCVNLLTIKKFLMTNNMVFDPNIQLIWRLPNW